MANPVFQRAEAFQPRAQQYPYPGHGYPTQPAGQAWGSDAAVAAAQTDPRIMGQAAQRPMTFDDVIARTGIVLLLIAAVGAATFMAVGSSPALMGAALVLSSIVGFITVLVVSTRRTVPAAGVLAYGFIEGIFIGALSGLFEAMYPGIVVQAVLGTFAAAGVTLAAYKFFNIQVTPRFRQIVLISTFGFAAVMLLNLVLALFGVDLGLRSVGGGISIIAILASAVGVVLAAMNLVVDFDAAEQGVRNQAPASESWRAAFGIAVTMVWLYTEILRIASYFRN